MKNSEKFENCFRNGNLLLPCGAIVSGVIPSPTYLDSYPYVSS